jgi:hypothetical protein
MGAKQLFCTGAIPHKRRVQDLKTSRKLVNPSTRYACSGLMVGEVSPRCAAEAMGANLAHH